jgi:hypothetical protein
MQKIIGLLGVPVFALISISNVSAQVPSPVTITTASLPSSTFGQTISIPLSAAGGVAPYSWSATNLPNGVSIDASGILSGIPETSNVIASTVDISPVFQVYRFCRTSSNNYD